MFRANILKVPLVESLPSFSPLPRHAIQSHHCFQVKGIPFLAMDAGGVLEMFDPETNGQAVIPEPTINALHFKIKGCF